MNANVTTIRLLGTVQLIVIVGSLILDSLLNSAVGPGDITNILVNISNNIARMRLSNLIAHGQSFVIVVMGVLYYVVFYENYKTIAMLALGCFLIAAVTIAISKIGTNALIPLSQDFIEAGSPDTVSYQTLGDFLYYGIDRRGNDIHMLFISLGFLLTNYLFLISRYIPRAISIWGLVAIFLLLIPTVLTLYDPEFLPGAMILALPYAPY